MNNIVPVEVVRYLLLASAAMGATGAFAQTNSPTPGDKQPEGLEEILVTAQRVSERLSRIPVAVTAVSGSDLAKQRITDVQSLTGSVPNLNFGSYGGTARIAIRGVGFDSINTGAEGRVAYYVDNVYYSRPATAASGFFDVSRIEVLRGPQGTLYGRNATGGALNVITADPTEDLSGYFRQTIGNYSLFTEEAALSGPIADVVQARLAAQITNRDGYGKNLLTGREIDNASTQSVRGKLKILPDGPLTFLVAVDYHHEKDRNFAAHRGGQAFPMFTEFVTLLPVTSHGAPVPADIRDINSQRDPYNRRNFWGTGLTSTYDFGEISFKSTTAYRHTKYENLFNLSTGDSFMLTIAEKSDQYSQEFQLSKQTGRLRWVAGVYGFHERIKGSVEIPFGSEATNLATQTFGLTLPSSPNGFLQGYWAGGVAKTDTVAGFGQATYSATDKLDLTFGIRYAWERKTVQDANQFDLFDPYNFSNPLTSLPPLTDPQASGLYHYDTHAGKLSDTSFTPKVTISYRFTPDVNMYATVAKGYKSGGFDLGSVQPAFKPETLWNYEVGLKAELFDRRLRIAASGFYYDYKNLQVALVKQTTIITQNAASARTYGAEIEVQAKIGDHIQFTLNEGYLDAKFKRYVTADPTLPGAPVIDYAGNYLPQSPRLQGKAGLEFGLDAFNGWLSLRGEVEHVSRVYFTPFGNRVVSQAAHAKGNAFLEYRGPSDKMSISLWVRNITDKTTISASTVTSTLIGTPLVSYLAPPRTFGVTGEARF